QKSHRPDWGDGIAIPPKFNSLDISCTKAVLVPAINGAFRTSLLMARAMFREVAHRGFSLPSF
ncbi:MAG: hypothetical protein ACK2UJ_12145, partial [Candidatus Promineifilaceae bacterium]